MDEKYIYACSGYLFFLILNQIVYRLFCSGYLSLPNYYLVFVVSIESHGFRNFFQKISFLYRIFPEKQLC